MASEELEALCCHINGKIGCVKKLLQLRAVGREASSKGALRSVGQEMAALHGLLERLDGELGRQRQLAALLQAMRSRVEKEKLEAELLGSNVPIELSCPKKEPRLIKKPIKEVKFVKDAVLITADELEAVPGYMRGRLTLPQINAALLSLHAAAVAKYQILHQNPKSIPASGRCLYQRFQEEETKETKGRVFVVEADLKEFTQTKMDRRFHAILNVLRHCQRVREVRGARLKRRSLAADFSLPIGRAPVNHPRKAPPPGRALTAAVSRPPDGAGRRGGRSSGSRRSPN